MAGMSAVLGWDERTVRYALQERQPLSVIFMGPEGEMIRIARDGFYVRGERVEPQSADEAKKVYRAFIGWMRLHGMAV
jgi:hypothetical protein